MLIAGLLFLCAAAVSAAFGARALVGSAPEGGVQKVLRAVAPTQLAAAVMLAAGGIIALSGRAAPALLVLCVLGAVGTVSAGVWQGARYAQATARRQALACNRIGACANCTSRCREI
ncbi:MAG TPA: hypothetical protein VMU34_11335 [Mycobacterium sp.]|nr:hypothetical protein [Mycobacterium sp.]